MKLTITLLFLAIAIRSMSQEPESEAKCKKGLKRIDGMEVLECAEKPPVYKGGTEEYFRLISKNIRYPPEQKVIQSNVYVAFVIDTLGHVRNECVIKRFDVNRITPLEQEVLRLVKLFEDWEPGQLNGRKVPFKYVMPMIIDPAHD